MFKFLVKLAFVVMGFYLLAQIPYFQGYVEDFKDAFYAKIANVNAEITRITEKAESAKAKVDETKETVTNIKNKVKETTDTVGNALDTVNKVVNDVDKAFKGDEEEEGAETTADSEGDEKLEE